MSANFDDFGLKDWDLELTLTRDDLRPAVEQLCEDVLRAAIDPEDEPSKPYLSFPIEWYPDSDGIGHEPPSDPLTVYVNFPGLSKNCDAGPFLIFNLRDDLADSIESTAKDGSFREGLVLLRDALRGLADEIDAALLSGEAPKP